MVLQHPGQGCIVMDVLAETVLLWTHVEGPTAWRCQGALGREELTLYLLYRAMTCCPSSVLTWAGQISKGSQHAAQQVTETWQAERQAGFYRTLTLWSRAGLQTFTLDLMWLRQGQEEKGEKQREPGTLSALLYLPHHRQRPCHPCSLRGTEAGTEHCQGLSPVEQSLIH